jgi:4-hydroxymandelate oxidase
MVSRSPQRCLNQPSDGEAGALTDRTLLTIADYEALSREILPRQLFDVLFGAIGTPGFEANTNNILAFRSTRLRPRVMAGIRTCKLWTNVLGQRIELPVMLAPAGYHQRAHPLGELATARAARAAGTVFTVSTASTFSIEEVAAATDGPLWFQLYMFKDRDLDARLLERAEVSGYKALMVTVDHLGRSRERELRYDFTRHNEHRVVHTIDPDRVLRNFQGMGFDEVPGADNYRANFDEVFGWHDIAWLRSRTSLPIVIKGIQTEEDARLCVEHGIDGIVVSNHGGHASPDAKGTLETLVEVSAPAQGSLEIYLDGGVRQGSDVLKALALGARAVLIGRPIFWGLAVDGELGMRSVLDILRRELESNMTLCGVADVENVSSRLVATPAEWGRNEMQMSAMAPKTVTRS